MKKYNFLFKPVFYIFSLLFATWLVVEIEKISPSDFGEKDPSIDQKHIKPSDDHQLGSKKYLQNLCSEYKAGKIDSAELNKKLIIFLGSTTNASLK